MEKKDIQNQQDIKILVNQFYNKVQQDEMLAPIFDEKICDWESHLHIMYSFWNSILLGDDSYRGQPLFKHVNLKIEAVHFKRWLELFYRTLDDNFEGPIVDLAKERSESIANVFYKRIIHIRSKQ